MEPDQNPPNPAVPNGFTPEQWENLREEVSKRIYGEDPAWGFIHERDYGSGVTVEAGAWEELADMFQEEFRERADRVLPVLVEQVALAWERGKIERRSRNPYEATEETTHNWDDYHVGRAWSGTDIEDACPCPQEPCGLVRMGTTDPSCEQHQPIKTVRQVHAGSKCPGARS